jgi:hypothetical protein
MKEQQASMAAAMAIGRLQARQGYVTNLFVERGCKPSRLDRAVVAAEKAALAGGTPSPSVTAGGASAAAPEGAAERDASADAPAGPGNAADGDRAD